MEQVLTVKTKKAFWSQIIKGVLLATSVSLIGILIFALIIKFVGISSNLIMPINQVIKVISLFLGCFFALKTDSTKGLLKGLIIGFLYTIFAYLLFSLLSTKFAFNLTLLNDILFGTLIGGICGIIAVNLRK